MLLSPILIKHWLIDARKSEARVAHMLICWQDISRGVTRRMVRGSSKLCTGWWSSSSTNESTLWVCWRASIMKLPTHLSRTQRSPTWRARNKCRQLSPCWRRISTWLRSRLHLLRPPGHRLSADRGCELMTCSAEIRKPPTNICCTNDIFC